MSSKLTFHERVLLNIERLNILRDLALLEAKTETVYDRLTTFASKIVDAPVSLVSLVAADFQFFKSHTGLPEPWASKRSTPLSHSFCQHVVVKQEPLVIEDARKVDFLKDNRAIPDLNVIGYLGIPLTLSNDTSLGSFCVIDGEPRAWTDIEIGIMNELADILIFEFETRAQVNMQKATQTDLATVHHHINKLLDSVDTVADLADILDQIKSLRKTHQLV